jgi:hypothetical protein
MFVGLTIEDMVVGGPAFNSQELERGDTLLAVDGQVTALPSAPCVLVRHPRASWLFVRASWLPWFGAFTLYKMTRRIPQVVSEATIAEAILGSDVPGTAVRLTVARGAHGKRRDVILTRMSTRSIADNVRMFELFTSLKTRAFQSQDVTALAHLDDCISLWTQMLIADADHDRAVVHNVLRFQRAAHAQIGEIKALLFRLAPEAADPPAAVDADGTDAKLDDAFFLGLVQGPGGSPGDAPPEEGLGDSWEQQYHTASNPPPAGGSPGVALARAPSAGPADRGGEDSLSQWLRM